MSTKQEYQMMLYHTHACYMNAMYNPNLPSDYKKTLNYSDFDFLDILDDSLTTKERRQRREEKIKQSQINEVNNLGALIKQMATAKGKKDNGKKE